MEGLREYNANIPTVPIVIAIIAALFIIQQFGTGFVGRFFGPIMLVWFTMIGVLGFNQIVLMPGVLKALNPYYAIHLLTQYPGGFWLLGAVFLATTGAEALYSDLGHCGKKNIRITWSVVKVMLLLNYFGQGAWLLQHTGEVLEWTEECFTPSCLRGGLFPELSLPPPPPLWHRRHYQRLIYLVNEAMRLNFWPKSVLVFPTNFQGATLYSGGELVADGGLHRHRSLFQGINGHGSGLRPCHHYNHVEHNYFAFILSLS